MKSTGIVRQVDELGRVVLPIELRRTLDIEIRNGLEIFVEGERIILRKYTPGCTFCDDAEDIRHFHGKAVCARCVGELETVLAKQQAAPSRKAE